jgi:hypothetical protein
MGIGKLKGPVNMLQMAGKHELRERKSWVLLYVPCAELHSTKFPNISCLLQNLRIITMFTRVSKSEVLCYTSLLASSYCQGF